MLSILIPTYNHDCTTLLITLAQQRDKDMEIIVGDDCSTQTEVAQQNQACCQKLGIRYVQADSNRGSAATRNMLCREAKGEWLLYIDCDSVIDTPDFLQRYHTETEEDTVLCGTIHHPETCPSPTQSLRWRYEKKAEKQFTLAYRNEHPYAHFRTSHFAIMRQQMDAHPFDESIRRSGYEDVLFGKHLQEAGIRIRHTDIAVTNGDIETNEAFLYKTEQHIETLYMLRKELAGHSSLLSTYARAKRWHLLFLLKAAYKMLRKPIRRNLTGSKPCIKLFQFYKLGYFAQLTSKKNL